MIKIDLNIAIATFLTFSILLVFVLWLFYNYRRESILGESTSLRQCPYCTSIFSSEKTSTVEICPKCKSYISPEQWNKMEGLKDKLC